jgi:hypothetical protein
MMNTTNSRPVKGKDGKHHLTPTIPVSPEDRQYLEAQLEKLHAYKDQIKYFKSLPTRLRTELREHVRWITAGIRQAKGEVVHSRSVRTDNGLPTERILIRRANESARGVDALIEECKQKAPKNPKSGIASVAS